jgi:hypothetical protein
VIAIVPTVAAVAVGVAIRYSPLEASARGITTAAMMALTFAALLWLRGPSWLRSSA